MIDPALRIAELEAELRQRDDKIKQLNRERDEAGELADQMREHTEEVDNRLLENWIEVFEMQRGDSGNWMWDPAQSELWDKYLAALERERKLVTEWNKFVGKYNAVVAPRERGRPLAASAAQQAEVVRQRKAGETLPAIAMATSLSLRTVRTITEKAAGKGRAGKRTNELRRKEFDRQRAAAYRVRYKARDELPKQIAEVQKTGAALIKAAKGLGRDR